MPVCTRQEWPSIGHYLDESRMYWPQSKSMMQSLLGILADIDSGHEEDVEKLSNARDLEAGVRTEIRRKLDQAHRERREPFARQVALLEAVCWPVSLWRDHRSRMAGPEADHPSRRPSTPQLEDHHPARLRRTA